VRSDGQQNYLACGASASTSPQGTSSTCKRSRQDADARGGEGSLKLNGLVDDCMALELKRLRISKSTVWNA
jgi:hypothetical protein